MWAWIGVLLVIWGAKCIADRLARGWLFALAGNICWIVVGVQAGDWNIIGSQVLFLCVNIYGFRKWRRAQA